MESPDAQAGPAANSETISVEKQHTARALALLKKLPRQQRQALLIALDDGVSVATAAGALGISVSAFKMRVHRAHQPERHL